MSYYVCDKDIEKIYSDSEQCDFIKAIRKGVMHMVCRECGQVWYY